MSYHDISQYHEHGNLIAYTASSQSENLDNYLDETDCPGRERIVDFVRQNCRTVAVLHNLRVDEEHRGQGIGSALFDAAMGAADLDGADLIVLLADSYDDAPFSLTEWYEGWGFQIVADPVQGPLMVAGAMADALRAHLAPATNEEIGPAAPPGADPGA